MRLCRLIIVDDEEDIRLGLTDIINWSDLGFVLCGEFESAVSALEYIKNNPVDIVLTDINMVNMNGLDFAKLLNLEYPEIKVVILSGYKQFEYVKTAMNYNVISYLLKPTDIDEVEETFSKIRRQFCEEQLETEKIVLMEKSMNYIANDFLKKCLNGYFSENHQELLQNCELSRLNIILDNPCAVYLFYTENTENPENENITDILNKYFRTDILNFSLYNVELNEKIKIIVCSSDKKNTEFNGYFDITREKIKIDYNIDCYIRHEYTYDSLYEMADKYYISDEDEKGSVIIKNALAFIDVNYASEVSLEDVANHVYVNSSYLSRLFKKETNLNFIEYLKKIRMERAKEMLKKRGSKLEDVCYAVGYKSEKYFIKLFSQYTGMTIKEYRKKWKV